MDNPAHLHLLVNHFPIIGAALAVPILVLALVLRKERGLLLAGVFLLVVAAATGWYSEETGEEAMSQLDGDEDKKWYGTYRDAEEMVEEHEERAEKANLVAYGAAALGLVVLVMAHRRPAESPLPRPWVFLVLVGAAATAGAMGWVGNAGGVIMHREIRGDSLDTTAK